MRTNLLLIASCCLALGACGHATSGQIARNAAGIVVADTAKDEYVRNCIPKGDPHVNCESDVKKIQNEGKDYYKEQKRAEDDERAEKLTEDFDAFMNDTKE